MKQVNRVEFEETIKDGLILVDFFATWCGPCKMLSPILDELSEEVKDVKFIKVDVDEEGDLAREYGVMSIPNVFLIKDGHVVDSFLGLQSKETIIDFINKNR